jgi:quercetin dioxygenase-like cupin family protein
VQALTKEMEFMSTSEVIRVGPIEVRFLLESPQTAGNQTMFEFRVPSRARVPVPHSHTAFDETLYGLDGATTWTLDGQKVRVGPGEVLFIPRGRVHQFENPEALDARVLSVITPGLLGPQYFQDIAAVLNVGGPPDVKKIAEVMLRHGLLPVLPAPA